MNNTDYRGIPEEYIPISVKEYIIYNIIFAIPIVGILYMVKMIIMEDNKNKKNFALSYLVVIVIFIVLFIIFKEPLLKLIVSAY